MRIKRWASLAVAAGTLSGVAALPATTAQAAATSVNVQVGGDSLVSGVAFEGMRFLAPPTFSVHKGDTINFTFDGFHTATMLPVGQSPDEWAAENIESPTGKYAFILPDDEAGTFEFNPLDAFPSDPTCGAATSPCAYDGKDVVNSGLPLASSSFAATVNAQPGDTFWVICLVHPGMAMRVQVVADSVATTTQAEIDGYKSQTLAADHESAAALVPALEKPSRHKTSSGAVVWDAYAGFDQNGYGLDAMFPSVLHIKKGQRVRWHFSQLMGNVHTVTFPRKQAVALNKVFGDPKCEGQGTAPDTAPDAAPPQFCSSGPQNLELEIPAAALAPAGNGKYAGTSTGLTSSGIEGAGAPSMAPYDVKFTHRSHKKGFRYACIVHGGMMSGTVVVS